MIIEAQVVLSICTTQQSMALQHTGSINIIGQNPVLINPRLDWLSDISNKGDVPMVSDEEDAPEDLYEYAKDSLYAEDIAVYSPKGGILLSLVVQQP